MVANYLIGLREGLEAALVVGILIAYLVRAQRRDRLAPVWIGIAIAVAISIGFGALLTVVADSMGAHAEQIFAGTMTFIAVGFVTWMIVWMRGAARTIKGHLDDRMGSAVEVGAWAVGATAFLAVAREGLETALFLWSSITARQDTAAGLIGATLGLATAVLLGYSIYRGALKLNLATFFRWTSIALIVIAAGLVAGAVHEFQEAGFLGGADTLAFDFTSWLNPDSMVAVLLGGLLNIEPAMTVGQVAAWLLYLVPTLLLYLRHPRPAATPPGVVTPSGDDAADSARSATFAEPRTPSDH